MYFPQFGERLKQLRTGRGLTQQEFGKRVGLSKAVVSKYENSLGYPTLDVLLEIAGFFNVSTDYLLGAVREISVDASGLTGDQLNAVSRIISEFRAANKK